MVELMFLGQYRHNLDDKSRLIIPARFRDLLEDGGFVLQGFDRNLMVVQTNTFELYSARLYQMSMTNPDVRILRRIFFGTASRAEIDRSGRILVPNALRQYAGIDSETVIVGAGQYFEIWSPALWDLQLDALLDANGNSTRFTAFDLSMTDR